MLQRLTPLRWRTLRQVRQVRQVRQLRWLPALAAGLVLSACGGGSSGNNSTAESGVAVATSAHSGSDRNPGSSPVTPISPLSPISPAPDTVSASTEGRLLASNCFQCHGTGGTGGFDNIRGSEAHDVLEFLTDNPSSNIMAAHAQGYTPAQLQKIIAYLQQP